MLFLDITVDRLPSNPNDPLQVLRSITNKQDELIVKAIKVLDDIREDFKKFENAEKVQQPIVTEDLPYRKELL